jgi:conjugative transfer signal peptidase TraF
MRPAARPLALGLAGLLGLCGLDVAASRALGRGEALILNESPSLPMGLYLRRRPEPIARGDVVAVRPPSAAWPYLRSLGVRPGARLLKRVAAAAGDRVCARDTVVTTPARRVDAAAADRRGRALPRWRGCRRLAPGELFVLGDTPISFDSRYFGPVAEAQVDGTYREVLGW